MGKNLFQRDVKAGRGKVQDTIFSVKTIGRDHRGVRRQRAGGAHDPLWPPSPNPRYGSDRRAVRHRAGARGRIVPLRRIRRQNRNRKPCQPFMPDHGIGACLSRADTALGLGSAMSRRQEGPPHSGRPEHRDDEIHPARKVGSQMSAQGRNPAARSADGQAHSRAGQAGHRSERIAIRIEISAQASGCAAAASNRVTGQGDARPVPHPAKQGRSQLGPLARIKHVHRGKRCIWAGGEGRVEQPCKVGRQAKPLQEGPNRIGFPAGQLPGKQGHRAITADLSPDLKISPVASVPVPVVSSSVS